MGNTGNGKTASLMLWNCNVSFQNEKSFQSSVCGTILNKSNWKIDPKFELWTKAQNKQSMKNEEKNEP